MIEANKEAVTRFWQAACTALALDPACLRGSFHFGHTPEMASALAAELTDGAKRATAGLVAEMEANNEPLPKVGDYWIVIDGAGQPAAAIQSRDVQIAPFRTVDEAFAWDEGEGDRGLAFWRGAHVDYFRRSCARLGITWSEDLDVLFERFDVIWPEVSAERLILRRPCATDEWSAYHRLRAELFARYLPDLTYDPGHAENWTPDVHHLAAFSAGELLGCLQIRWLSPDQAAFQLVAFKEKRRGRGLGRFLLSQAEIFAEVNGRRLIRLFGEPEALGFYRRLGFVDGPDRQETPLSAAAIPLKKQLR